MAFKFAPKGDPALAAFTKPAPPPAPTARAPAPPPPPAPTTTGKTRIGLRIDNDVLDAFKRTGPGWQTRMNDILRVYVEAAGLTNP